MPDYPSISKKNPAFPDYLDFQALRRIGIDHVQALSKQLWTDYNLHDPGVTILEVLCYAVTDLGYRNNLNIKDLLALNPKDAKEKETNFFTPDEILTCNPVTEMDWRKRLIDIAGVRNAWLEKVGIPDPQSTVQEKVKNPYEPAIYVDANNGRLQYTIPVGQREDQAIRLNPKGLYRVCLDLDPDPRKDACGQTDRPWDKILQEVKAVLCRDRNLCEDFYDVVILGEEEIGLCTDIELEAGADPEDVQVEIYVRVQEFLAPRLRFYTLQELLAQGKSLADIFAGRPASVLHDETTGYHSHGFIDTNELEAMEPPKVIHTSDLYQIIMGVAGVAAIKKLSLINYINGLRQSEGSAWCLQLTEKHRPILGVVQSRVTFFKGDLPFKADAAEVERRYYEQQSAYIKAPRESFELDLSVPQGSYFDLADHYSIHHDFPLTYGIGEAGLPDNATSLRKAQAKQLKGYLIFFDQVLANYLAQLAHVRDLFSWESEKDRRQHANDNQQHHQRTYFAQNLTNVPAVQDIIRNYHRCAGSDLPREELNGLEESNEFTDYIPWLEAIREDPLTYRDRRNRFLDHLLARFAETLTDYVLINYRIDGGRRDDLDIIDDKARFLQDYPTLSRDRFRAFNYCNCDEIWDTNNVSGFQKRVSRILGTDIATHTQQESPQKKWRRSLSHYEVISEGGGFRLKLQINVQSSTNNSPEVSLYSKQIYADLATAQAALERFLTLSLNPNNYKRLSYRYFYRYGWEIVDQQGNGLVADDRIFLSQGDRNAALAPLLRDLISVLEEPTNTGSTEFVLLPNIIQLETFVEDQKTFFVFKLKIVKDAQTLIFKSIQHYVTETDARIAAEEALEQIKTKENYHPSLKRLTYYGYGLIDSDGKILAESNDRFPPIADRDIEPQADRDIALQRWLSYLQSNQNEFLVEPSTECFFFELKDRTGEQVLLRGVKGLSTNASAADEFTIVLAQGKVRHVYSLIDEVAAFSFFLHLETDIPFARNPHTYTTEIERNLRLDALLYYLNQFPPESRIIGETGTYCATLLDRDGNPMLITYHSYSTQSQAEAAYQRLLHLASDPVYFQPINDFPNESPYGFELVDRHGNTFAIHPQSYSSSCDRDRAMQALIDLVISDEQLHRIDGVDGQFTYALVDILSVMENLPDLLNSAVTYADAEIAQIAFTQMLSHAARSERYRRLDRLPSPQSFGFELLDETGEAIAYHLDLVGQLLGYATESEREAAIEKIACYAFQSSIRHEIVNEEGSFFAEVGDEADDFRQDRKAQRLWIGRQNFPTKVAAEVEADRIRDLSRQQARYLPIDAVIGICSYSFALMDEAGVVIADHAGFYETTAERDRQIQQLWRRFGGTEAFVQIREQPATATVPLGYRFEIPAELFCLFEDCEANWQQAFQTGAILSSPKDQVFATAAAATTAFVNALKNQNFVREYNNEACTFNFELKDPTGNIVATSHPRIYRDRAEMEAVIAFIQQIARGFRFTKTITGTCCGYYFFLTIPREDRMELKLRSLNRYPTEERAWQAARTFSENLRYLSRYHNPAISITGQSYGLGITDALGSLLAATTEEYDPFLAFQKLNAVENFLQIITIPAAIGGEIPTFRFNLVDRTGRILLEGAQTQVDENTVRTHFYRDVLSILFEPAAIARTTENGEPPFGFCVVSLSTNPEAPVEILAIHPQTYISVVEKEEAIAHLLLLLRTARLTAEVQQLEPAYTGKICDREKQTLLQSTERFETVQQVWEQGNTLVELAQNTNYFRLIDDEDSSCLYSWELTNETKDQVLAEPPQPFSNPKDRDMAIVTLQDRINDEGFHVVEHILLRPKHPLPEPVCSFAPDERLLDGVIPQNAISFLANLTVQNGLEGFSFTVEDEQGQILFRSQSFSTQSERDQAMELMMLNGLPEEITEPPPADRAEFHSNLVDRSFVCKTDRDQMIGQSRSFASLPELEAQKQWLQNNLHKFAPQFGIGGDRLKQWQEQQEPRDNYDLTQSSKTGRVGFERFLNQERDRYYFHVNDCWGNALFYSEAYIGKASRDKGVRSTIRNSIIEEHYTLKKIPERDRTVYFFTLRAANGQEIGRSRYFDALWKLEACLDWFKHHTHQYAQEFGVEMTVPTHLQASEPIADKFLAIAKNSHPNPEIPPCSAAYDPYSFWISVILPYWPTRFRDINFRRLVERTLRLEAPAHVALKICWVNVYKMHEFEEAYHNWLEQLALETCQDAACDPTGTLNRLLTILPELKNVYPEGTLHDCDESGPDDNPIVLNQTALGTANE
jgi:uncharacterized protein YegP (UPF0339 family)